MFVDIIIASVTKSLMRTSPRFEGRGIRGALFMAFKKCY